MSRLSHQGRNRGRLKGEGAEGCRVPPALHAWGYGEYPYHCHGGLSVESRSGLESEKDFRPDLASLRGAKRRFFYYVKEG